MLQADISVQRGVVYLFCLGLEVDKTNYFYLVLSKLCFDQRVAYILLKEVKIVGGHRATFLSEVIVVVYLWMLVPKLFQDRSYFFSMFSFIHTNVYMYVCMYEHIY